MSALILTCCRRQQRITRRCRKPAYAAVHTREARFSSMWRLADDHQVAGDQRTAYAGASPPDAPRLCTPRPPLTAALPPAGAPGRNRGLHRNGMDAEARSSRFRSASSASCSHSSESLSQCTLPSGALDSSACCRHLSDRSQHSAADFFGVSNHPGFIALCLPTLARAYPIARRMSFTGDAASRIMLIFSMCWVPHCGTR